MNATKTTTIALEIKGQKIELTEAEARELAGALNRVLGIPEIVTLPPMPVLPESTPYKRPFDPFEVYPKITWSCRDADEQFVRN